MITDQSLLLWTVLAISVMGLAIASLIVASSCNWAEKRTTALVKTTDGTEEDGRGCKEQGTDASGGDLIYDPDRWQTIRIDFPDGGSYIRRFRARHWNLECDRSVNLARAKRLTWNESAQINNEIRAAVGVEL